MVVSFSFDANKYFNDSEPWAVKKKDLKRMETILYTISVQIKNISILLNPIIPLSTNKVLDTLNIDKSDRVISNITDFNGLFPDKNLKDIKILFNKIEDDN